MTENEIIKNLEKVANADCNRCSFNNENCDGEDCDKYIAQKILDIINRQKAEAIKEFAEKLKENTVTVKLGKQICKVITDEGIDYLVKEMVGEK